MVTQDKVKMDENKNNLIILGIVNIFKLFSNVVALKTTNLRCVEKFFNLVNF
jgi:hypothetical protein